MDWMIKVFMFTNTTSIREYCNDERIVIMASHSKEDIALLCDQVFYMSQGRLKLVKEEL